jgi:hypothetical protein
MQQRVPDKPTELQSVGARQRVSVPRRAVMEEPTVRRHSHDQGETIVHTTSAMAAQTTAAVTAPTQPSLYVLIAMVSLGHSLLLGDGTLKGAHTRGGSSAFNWSPRGTRAARGMAS